MQLLGEAGIVERRAGEVRVDGQGDDPAGALICQLTDSGWRSRSAGTPSPACWRAPRSARSESAVMGGTPPRPLGELDPQRALTMAAESKLPPRSRSGAAHRRPQDQDALAVLAERLARTRRRQQKDLAVGINLMIAKIGSNPSSQIPSPTRPFAKSQGTPNPQIPTSSHLGLGLECGWDLGFGAWICLIPSERPQDPLWSLSAPDVRGQQRDHTEHDRHVMNVTRSCATMPNNSVAITRVRPRRQSIRQSAGSGQLGALARIMTDDPAALAPRASARRCRGCPD